MTTYYKLQIQCRLHRPSHLSRLQNPLSAASRAGLVLLFLFYCASNTPLFNLLQRVVGLRQKGGALVLSLVPPGQHGAGDGGGGGGGGGWWWWWCWWVGTQQGVAGAQSPSSPKVLLHSMTPAPGGLSQLCVSMTWPGVSRSYAILYSRSNASAEKTKRGLRRVQRSAERVTPITSSSAEAPVWTLTLPLYLLRLWTLQRNQKQIRWSFNGTHPY